MTGSIIDPENFPSARDDLNHPEDVDVVCLRVGNAAILINWNAVDPDGVSFVSSDRLNESLCADLRSANHDRAMGTARWLNVLVVTPECLAKTRV